MAWAACGEPPDTGQTSENLRQAALDAATLCDPNHTGLRITELMPNPAGPDRGHEWVELYNASAQPLCLDRAELKIGPPWAPRSHVISHVGCMPPYALWVWGDGTGPIDTDPQVPVRYRYGNLTLPNDVGALAVVCQGQTLAAMEYGPGAQAPSPASGRALAFVPPDGPGRWCVVQGVADACGNVGSPGRENPGCALCLDEGGALRPPRPVAPGDVMVSRVLADPPGPDADREWVELTTGERAVDLYHLTLEAHAPGRRTRVWLGPQSECATLAPHHTVRMPVCRIRPGADGPWAWQGPGELFNQAMALRLVAQEGLVHEVVVPKSQDHEPVYVSAGPLCSPTP